MKFIWKTLLSKNTFFKKWGRVGFNKDIFYKCEHQGYSRERRSGGKDKMHLRAWASQRKSHSRSRIITKSHIVAVTTVTSGRGGVEPYL